MPDAPEQNNSHDQLIDQLLALPEVGERADILRQHDLLTPEGLDTLIDRADDLLNSDPGKARKLAELCMELADVANAPAAVPKANYVIAGAYDLNGDFEKALELTQLAHDGYMDLGMGLEALRTEVGKMSALLDLGQYSETLEIGHHILQVLKSTNYLEFVTLQLTGSIEIRTHMNIGICYEYIGMYKEAINTYKEAERISERLGEVDYLSQLRCNRGLVLLNMGKAREALSVFEAAATLFAGTTSTISYAAVLMNLGYTHLQLGNFVQSLRAFEKVLVILHPLEASADEHRVLLDMANTYADLNLHSEALNLYREAKELLKPNQAQHRLALTYWGEGSVLVAMKSFSEAFNRLSKAIELFQNADNIPLLGSVMLEKSALLSAMGDEESALEVSQSALSLVSKNPESHIQNFYANLRVAELLLPDEEQSLVHLNLARGLLENVSLPQLWYRFNECLGRVRHSQGQYREAKESYEKALEIVESLRGTVTKDSMRSSFLKDKMNIFENLLTLDLETSSEENLVPAFISAERAKSRSLTDMLTGVIPKTAVSDQDESLSKQISNLQADLVSTYNILFERGMQLLENRSSLPNLWVRVSELEGEISRLRLRFDASEIESSDPFETYATPRFTPSILSTDVVLLAYHVLEDEIIAFVVSGGEVRVERNVGSVEKVRGLFRKLDSQWDRFRSGQSYSEKQLAMLEKSTSRILAALYDEAVRPVESLLDEAVERLDLSDGEIPKLAIVPHGSLHQAPLHAFFDGESYLLERFEVSYAPSATVFALCQERESRSLDRAVAVGVSDELIPTARDEAEAVAGLFPEPEVLLEDRATPEALEEAVAGCGVLHMACHGMFRSDNPMFSALKLHEGWLLAHDAMGLDLDGAVVTLSACESGRNVVVGGDEILGLTRAFLGAGVATLVASLWVVHDDTTPDLMRHFYRRLISGDPPATALRAAQLHTKQTHPHPYYWAPFITVGKR